MPILNIHLVAGQHAPEQLERLVVQCNELFASVLNCPVDRIRVFVTEHAPRQMCIGGKLATEAEPAPFFSFYVLEGRSLEDRQRLLAGFVDLIAEILAVDRSRIRGCVERIEPEDWTIGGTPASVLRQAEIAARRQAAAQQNQ
jgi:4-oxalocrotonate tautomerase